MDDATNPDLEATAEYETLATRVAALEAALARIQRECDHALNTPEVVFVTVCRISSVARQALGELPDYEASAAE